MAFLHQAVYNTYPQAKSILGQTVFDADGNELYVDVALMEQLSVGIQLQLDMETLRNKRDQLLAETDWWVLPDVNVTPEQLAYRQALRDLPQTAAAVASPSTVVFPTKPVYGGTR